MKHAKRMLSLLLTLLLLVNLIPAAFAADSGSDPPTSELLETAGQEADTTEEGDAGDPSATTPSSESSEVPSKEESPTASEEISEPIQPSMTDAAEETAPSPEASEVPSEEVPSTSEEVSEPTEPSTTEIAEESTESVEVEDTLSEEILPNDASHAETMPIAETAETKASGSPIVHSGNAITTNGTLTISYYNYLEGASKTAYIQAIDLKTIGSATVYCIEPEESSTGQSYTQDQQMDAWNMIPADKREAIGLALAYGYPNQSYSASSNDIYWYGKQAVLNTENYIATQLIVWEILAGVRSDITMQLVNSNVSYRNVFDSGWNTIRTTYDAIVAKMIKHNKIPAYASRNPNKYIYTLQYDSSTGTYRYMLPAERQSDWRECRITLPDGISYLKAADGMTVIGFEATPEAAAALPENGTTCTGTSPYLSVDPDTAVVCWQCSNSQTVATMPIGPDPARAYFTLKAAMNEDLEIIKTSDDGNVSGITFTIEEWVQGIGYCRIGTYTTDSQGKITVPNLSVGTKYRVTETVPENYEAEQQSQEITIQTGSNTLTFVNHLAVRDLEIIKTSPDGKVDGIEFYIKDASGAEVGRDTTKDGGKLTFEKLVVGQTYTVTEVVPDGYACENNNQSVTIQAGTNTLTFTNRRMTTLKIIKESSDGNVAGITFEVYRIRYSPKSLLATVTTDENGVILLDGLSAGVYVVKEIVPEGYAPQEMQRVSVTASNYGDNPAIVTFVNEPLRGTISVKKISTSGTALEGATFLLEYSTDGGETWDIIRPETNDDFLIGTCTTVDADGTFTTGADGTAVFDDLIVYGVMYRLTETAAPAGYQLLAEPVFTGEIDAGDNGSYEIYREVVNAPLLQMPPTGGDGSMSFLVSSSVLISVASALWLFLLLQKQRKANNKSKNSN